MWFNMARKEVMHLDGNKLNYIYKVRHSKLGNSWHIGRTGLRSSPPEMEMSPKDSAWVESIIKWVHNQITIPTFRFCLICRYRNWQACFFRAFTGRQRPIFCIIASSLEYSLRTANFILGPFRSGEDWRCGPGREAVEYPRWMWESQAMKEL